MQAFAQYHVSGEILDVGYAYDDVTVELKIKGNRSQIPVSNNGQFITSLEWNSVYFFTFKKPGFVSKVIEFSTELPFDVVNQTIEPYYMPVRLFEVFEGVDTVFFKNPVAKIRFDKNKTRSNGQKGDFAHDMDYSLKVKYGIDKMRQKGAELSHNKPRISEKKQTDTKVDPIANQVVKVKEADSDNYRPKTSKVAINDGFVAYKEVNGAPPLKEKYPIGETNESFSFKTREIERTVFIVGDKRRVFLSVKHSWGGHFYFIDEADIGYRCISGEVYNDYLKKYRNKIKQFK